MDETKALEIMQSQIGKVDGITAELFQAGINAINEKNNKKSINEQKQELYDRICNEICRHTEGVTSIYELMDIRETMCPKCPLYELTR